MMLVAGAMACGLAACSDDDTTPSGNITPADQLYLPRNNATIMLETGNTTHFEWAVSKASKNGYITYELLFDKVDGDFSRFMSSPATTTGTNPRPRSQVLL